MTAMAVKLWVYHTKLYHVVCTSRRYFGPFGPPQQSRVMGHILNIVLTGSFSMRHTTFRPITLMIDARENNAQVLAYILVN